MMILSERLKELREYRKLPQTELAKLLKITQSTYAMYETGKRKPDIEVLCRIADYYNVTTDYLLCRSDDITGNMKKVSAINNAIGLSKRAIYIINSMNHTEIFPQGLVVLNEFIESPLLEELLILINTYKETVEEYNIYRKNNPDTHDMPITKNAREKLDNLKEEIEYLMNGPVTILSKTARREYFIEQAKRALEDMMKNLYPTVIIPKVQQGDTDVTE